MISAEAVKNLRKKTGLSMIECQKALEEAGGEEQKALEILKQKGREKAEKKAERQIKAGMVDAYIHANQKIGVLLELGCETDFVARNENFKALAHDLCLHIAAASPQTVEEFLSQPFIKNPPSTIRDLINEYIAKLGENIKVSRFMRFEI